MNPKLSEQLLALGPITVTYKCESWSLVDWPKVFQQDSTFTSNGVTVPVEIKGVEEKDGVVSAILSFTQEDYEIIKKALEHG